MNPSPKQPPAPRRRIPWLVGLGAVLLAVSVIGAGKTLHSSGSAPPGGGNAPDVHAGGFGFYDVEAGVANLYPLQPGQVVEVLKHDGDRVKKGTELFRLDNALADADWKRARVAVADAEQQLRGARAKVEQHRALLDGQRQVIEAKEAKVRAAEAQRDKARRLFNSGNAAKEDFTSAEEAVRALKAEVKAEEAKERGFKAEDPTIAVRRAELDLDDKQQQLRKAHYALEQCVVKAPSDGTVLRMLVHAGETLGPNPHAPAVEFAPDGRRVIRAEVDQEFAARVRDGQPAQVQDDARNGAVWTGRVERVSNWYTHRRSILNEPLQFNDVRTLEVIIVLDDPTPDLKIGQRVRVNLE